MLCPRCGHYAENEERICPECGEILKPDNGLPPGGAQAIRQGKKAREAARSHPAPKAPETPAPQAPARRRREGNLHETAELQAVPDTRRTGAGSRIRRTGEENEEGEDGPGERIERKRRASYEDGAAVNPAVRYLAAEKGKTASRRKMVNWIRVAAIIFGVAVLLVAGAYVAYTRTWWGEMWRARHGKDATAAAYWAVGDERMDTGDIAGAVSCYEKAEELDAKAGYEDVDGLLMLGNAYEALDETKKAARLYVRIYTNTPYRTEAYVNHIRILQNSGVYGDQAKAAALMKKAYENTGDSTFLTQRDDLLPSPPEVNPSAGYYERKINISITSRQGYDIYYTFDENAKLPYGGYKFPAEGLTLEENIYNLRAVAVNGELVSDELKGTFKIIMPQPQKPRATLAPNTYKTSQKVKLKPGVDDERDTSIVIYYTVDGSIPNSDSPIFDGNPIVLPNGWVTLKAIAVNRYGKLSNMLEVKYKIDANPKPKTSYDLTDTIGGLKLTQTTQLEFFEKYGEGTAAGEVAQEGFDASSPCRRYDYPWGYAVMNLNKKKIWVLVEVCFRTNGTFSGPRGTNIGDTEKFVTGMFKDMLQVESKSGNRGLYSNNDGTGKIWVQENKEKIIRYQCNASEGHIIQLEYLLNTAGTVKQIDWKYIP